MAILIVNSRKWAQASIRAGSLRHWMMEIVLVLLCFFLAFNADGFFTSDNLLNVMRNVSMQGIIAFGMTVVIIAGEIDLSVGSAVAFAGCLTAFICAVSIDYGLSPILAVIFGFMVSIFAGLGLGSVTGITRTVFGVPTFITTLALMTVLRGSAQLITNGFPLTPFPDWYNFLGGGYIIGIPFPAIVFLVVFGFFYFVMEHTAFGRAVYAIGGNAEAARLNGINVKGVKITIMAAVSGLAALAGIMQSAEIMAGTPTSSVGWELDVISAVIIGGTSLMGGVGRVWGTMIGVFFLGIIVNGMTLMNISEYWQLVVRGCLILLAVLLNQAPGRKVA